MGDAKLKNSLPAVLNVPAGDADALLRSGDGDAALLYLYLLRRGGRLDMAEAARDMGRSDRDMTMAARRLAKLGLLSEAEGSGPPAGGDPPEYEARVIVRRSMEDKQFRVLVDEVELSLGRTLSRTDLTRLYAVYDELALPADVIMLLVQYCKDENERLRGPGRSVGMSFVYRVGQEWSDRELLTYEQAEQWLREREERRSQYGQLRQAMGLTDRDLTKTERGYIDGWLGMGFSVEAVILAAERTITNTGGLKWKYMDAILRSWDKQGLRTPAEIEAGDRKPGAREGAAEEWDDDKAVEQIKRLRDRMKQGNP